MQCCRLDMSVMWMLLWQVNTEHQDKNNPNRPPLFNLFFCFERFDSYYCSSIYLNSSTMYQAFRRQVVSFLPLSSRCQSSDLTVHESLLSDFIHPRPLDKSARQELHFHFGYLTTETLRRRVGICGGICDEWQFFLPDHSEAAQRLKQDPALWGCIWQSTSLK